MALNFGFGMNPYDFDYTSAPFTGAAATGQPAANTASPATTQSANVNYGAYTPGFMGIHGTSFPGYGSVTTTYDPNANAGIGPTTSSASQQGPTYAFGSPQEWGDSAAVGSYISASQIAGQNPDFFLVKAPDGTLSRQVNEADARRIAGLTANQQTTNQFLGTQQGSANTQTTNTSTNNQTTTDYDWNASYEDNFPDPGSDSPGYANWLTGKTIYDAMAPENRAADYFRTYLGTISPGYQGLVGQGNPFTTTYDPLAGANANPWAAQPLQNLNPGASGGDYDYSLPTMEDVRVASNVGPSLAGKRVQTLPTSPFKRNPTPGERLVLSSQPVASTVASSTQSAQAQQDTGYYDPQDNVTNSAMAAEQLAAQQAAAQQAAAQQAAPAYAQQYSNITPQMTGEIEQASGFDPNNSFLTFGAGSSVNWAQTAPSGSYIRDPWMGGSRFIIKDPSGAVTTSFDEAEAMQLAGRNVSNLDLLKTLAGQDQSLQPLPVSGFSNIATNLDEIQRMNNMGYRVVVENQR
jgi:hypothetical protein